MGDNRRLPSTEARDWRRPGIARRGSSWEDERATSRRGRGDRREGGDDDDVDDGKDRRTKSKSKSKESNRKTSGRIEAEVLLLSKQQGGEFPGPSLSAQVVELSVREG